MMDLFSFNLGVWGVWGAGVGGREAGIEPRALHVSYHLFSSDYFRTF